MRQYYVEIRKLGCSERDLVRANGRRDAARVAATVNRTHYRARVITVKA